MPRGKSVTKILLDSSQAALFAGIEIHNKPHILYRYPTAAMLIINAWELALKAYIYKYIGKNRIYDNRKTKYTISLSKANVLVRDHINTNEKNNKFQAVYENIDLLEQYRNANVHYVEEALNPIIFMLLSKAVLNYDAFLKKYFKKDITKDDNLIIMPVGFKLPFNPVDYLKQDYGKAHNDFVDSVVHSIRELNNNGIQESVVIGFSVYTDRIKSEKNADIIARLEKSIDAIPIRRGIKITDDPNAPEVRVVPDVLPLSYTELVENVIKRDPNIKRNNTFHDAMRKIKSNKKLCQVNYLDPKKKSGVKKEFFSYEAVDAVIKEYYRLKTSNS